MWDVLTKTTKPIERLILDRVSKYPSPYYYAIHGKNGIHYSCSASAYITYGKLKAWAEAAGAEVQIVRDEFKYKGGYERSKRLIVEITDPAAWKLDALLKWDM